MLHETRGREGVLPLLQFALERIWDGLANEVEPAETLKEIGGVGGALAGEAQRIYEGLPENEQRITRRVFLGLVQLGEGGPDTRRRAMVASLISVSDERERVEEVIRRFSAPGVRLITLSADQSGDDLAEVTHESLFAHWQQLDEWLASSRDDLRFQRRLDQACRHWKELSRADGVLWRAPDLDLLTQFHERHVDEMTPLQIDFFLASQQAAQARIAEEHQKQQLLRRRLRIAISSAVVSVVMLTIAIYLGTVASSRAKEAQRQESLAHEAKHNAEEAFIRSLKAIDKLTAFSESMRDVPGLDAEREEMLSHVAKTYERLADDDQMTDKLRFEGARGMLDYAELLVDQYQPESAIDLIQLTLKCLKELRSQEGLKDNPELSRNVEIAEAAAHCLQVKSAMMLIGFAQEDELENQPPDPRELLNATESLVKFDDETEQWGIVAADFLMISGTLESEEGRFDEARVDYTNAIERIDQIVTGFDLSDNRNSTKDHYIERLRDAARARSLLADLLKKNGQLHEASELRLDVVKRRIVILDTKRFGTLSLQLDREYLLDARINHATILQSLHRHEEALDELLKAYELVVSIEKSKPLESTDLALRKATICSTLGQVQAEMGKPFEKRFEEAASILAALTGVSEADDDWAKAIESQPYIITQQTTNLNVFGLCLYVHGRDEERGRRLIELTVRNTEKVRELNPSFDESYFTDCLSWMLLNQSQVTTDNKLFLRSVQIRKRLVQNANDLSARSRYVLAWMMTSTSDFADEGHELATSIPDNWLNQGQYGNVLAASHYRKEQWKLCVQAIEVQMSASDKYDEIRNACDAYYLAMARWKLGLNDEAKAAFKRGEELSAKLRFCREYWLLHREANSLLFEQEGLTLR